MPETATFNTMYTTTVATEIHVDGYDAHTSIDSVLVCKVFIALSKLFEDVKM